MSDGFSRRAHEAFARNWVLFIRQSTIIQRLTNVGSGDVQAQQLRTLQKMNVPQERILTIDARGESGRAEVIRHHFEELVSLVKGGTVGVLVLARFDRIGRNKEDTARLLRLLKAQKGMLLIDGRIYDPSEPTDQLSLGMQSAFAEYENLARMRWLQLARMEMARRMKTVVPLPTGLIWACLEDVEFRARLAVAGLGAWLERIGEHREAVGKAPDTKYVFPYPDREVYDAARLRLAWLLETHELSEVRSRIRDAGSGWPRPGLVPIVRASIYSTRSAARWIRLEQSDLNSWYRSPALYGTYAFTAWSLAAAGDLPVSEFTACEPGAFPSLAQPEDLERIETILQVPQRKPWKAVNPSRNHLLPIVRCANRFEDGRVCGRRMSAVNDSRDGTRGYATGCVHPRPNGNVSASIEPPVLEVILAALRPEEVSRAVDELRRDRDAVLTRRADAEAKLASLRSQSQAAMELAIRAQALNDAAAVPVYMESHSRLLEQASRAELAIASLRGEEGEIRSVTDADYARVLELARNLPELLERARALPEVCRRLVGEITRAVHVRTLASGVIELEVEFPTGTRVRRVVETDPTHSTQPQRLYAATRLMEGASPVEVARELNDALDVVLKRKTSMDAFNARRVRTMAAMHTHTRNEPGREGQAMDPAALEQRYGLPQSKALEAILLGALGPASWTADGTLSVVPTADEELRVFVEWVRRRVAAERDWPLEDTSTVVEAMELSQLSREEVVRRALRGSGAVPMPAYRVWVRRSEVEDPEGALRARLHAARPDLDPIWWVPRQLAAERLKVSRETVKSHCLMVSLPYGKASAQRLYAWLHPDTMAPCALPTLEDAVRALGAGYNPADFVALRVLAEDLMRRFGTGGTWMLQSAAKDGVIVSVLARKKGRGRCPSWYVLVPKEIREIDSAEQVLAWLGRTTRTGPRRAR